MSKYRKYNPRTECYEIDIYVNGRYKCSIDTAKTVEEAKDKFLNVYKHIQKCEVYAEFSPYFFGI